MATSCLPSIKIEKGTCTYCTLKIIKSPAGNGFRTPWWYFLDNSALWRSSWNINLRYLGWKVRAGEQKHTADERQPPSELPLSSGGVWASLPLTLFPFLSRVTSVALAESFTRRMRSLQAASLLRRAVLPLGRQRNVVGCRPASSHLWPGASYLTSLSLRILVSLTRMKG